MYSQVREICSQLNLICNCHGPALLDLHLMAVCIKTHGMSHPHHSMSPQGEMHEKRSEPTYLSMRWAT